MSCRFTIVNNEVGAEVGKTVFATFPLDKKGYADVGEFYCKAPAHPRAIVSLEITTNGQQYVGGVTEEDIKKTTFEFVQCPIGFVAPFYYRSCTVCDKGKYAVEGGKTCELCGLHTYTEKNASLSCDKCPINSKTIVLGSTSRLTCECMKNTYSLNTSWDKCLDCPEFGNCTGSWNIPKPIPGFWRTPECSSSQVCNNSFLLCRPRIACPGLQANNCSLGYAGPLCGQCEKGFFRLNQMCQDCPPTFGYQIAGWKKMKPIEVAFISLFILLLVQGSLLAVGAGCLTKRKDQCLASVGIVMSVMQAIALIVLFSLGLVYIPVRMNSLLLVQLCLAFAVISGIFFFGLLVTKLGSLFVLIHFVQLLYICGRFEVPWPPLFQLFFRLLGDYAMPLILYPSYVETLAPGCSNNLMLNNNMTNATIAMTTSSRRLLSSSAASNVTNSSISNILTPHEQFATHMMGFPATLMLVCVVFLSNLIYKFIWHLATNHITCCKKFGTQSNETFTYLLLDDARRFFHTQYVVFELNLIFVLAVLTSLSRCTRHPDGVMRYDGWPSEECDYGGTLHQVSVFYCVVFVLGLTLLQSMAGLKLGQFGNFAKRFRAGAKQWHLIVTSRSILFVSIAVLLDKMFEIPIAALPVIQCGIAMFFVTINGKKKENILIQEYTLLFQCFLTFHFFFIFFYFFLFY